MWEIFLSRKVVLTGLKMSFIVGSILALINHGNDIVSFTLSTRQIVQILTTYLVPYVVSTYSATKSIVHVTKESC